MMLPLAPASRLKSQTVIPIMGMHHSGTAFLARLFSEMGVSLDQPQESTDVSSRSDTSAGNRVVPASYFSSINSELLKLASCDPSGFDAPQKLTAATRLCGQITAEEFRRQEIAGFIRRRFPIGPWGWEDPRTVLTFGFWQRILGELSFSNVKPIIVVRHPSEVIRIMTLGAMEDSNQHLGAERLQHMASEVWLVYHQILWQYCRRHSWSVYTFESLTNPETATIQSVRLAASYGLDDSRVTRAVDWINPTECNLAIGEPSLAVTVPNAAIELYERFSRLAAPSRAQRTETALDSDETRLLQKAQSLKDSGRIDSAVELMTKALQIRPQYRATRFMLSYTLMETGHIERSTQHSQWLIDTQADDPVGYFLRSLLKHHDREKFLVTCYQTSPASDDLTTELQSQCDHWCEAHSMNDDHLGRQISGDGIDVLIDLSGHSSGNRCGVILRRSAPVQALYLGYPATSGLPAMDFVISDAHVSPPELNHLYTERVARLENSFLCFHPHDDAPEVSEPPCLTNGFVTFGSFNNLPKISRSTVSLWSEILKVVDNSRLVIKALSLVDFSTQELFYQHFAEQGIDRSRIDLLPPTVPLSKFLSEYRRIDIGLDPTPYNGGTTTCEALWMGIPVITLTGRLFCGRMGFSILKTLGMQDWVGQTKEEYIHIAAQLAAQPELIAYHRRTLRERMRNSALCNGQQFTADFERLCQSMVRQRTTDSP